jgi:hypothetical protein
MDDKTRYKFNTIKDLMKNVLQKNKLSQGINQLDVANAWRKVMGEGVWTYTAKVHLVKGNLTVSLRSSTIREELNYRKKEIIIMLNSYLKEELVNKIRLM